MITRRKVMAYLAGMFGAGVTGAKAAPSIPDDIFDGFWKYSAEYQNLASMFMKLGEAGPARGFGITTLAYSDLCGMSVKSFPVFSDLEEDATLLLMMLPNPTYEHAVFMDQIGNLSVIRPDPVTGYGPFDGYGYKRLR